MSRYFELQDALNEGTVVRRDGKRDFLYRFGPEEWAPTGMMISYEWPDDSLYGKYTEIDEPRALQLLNAQRRQLQVWYELARQVAEQAHQGQKDKGGRPYIEHPKAVAGAVEELEEKIVAWLHDVVEDSDTTLADLKQYGFSRRIVQSVDVLTRREGQNYEAYLKGVKRDMNAWGVKIADLKHNMDLTRIPAPTTEDEARLEKYRRALRFLEG